jgi:mannose-1-phosphate guanylyltransferase
MATKCFSVILAGGRGTRFWPLSRARRPKQLLKIIGPNSLIAATAERVAPLSGAAQTLVVTIADQLEPMRRELKSLSRRNFIVEPQGRNTAPCIGLAALELQRRDRQAVMVVLPADHWIGDAAAFRRTIRAAVRLANDHDRLITIGIRPEYPETGYGYIVKGKQLSDGAAKAAFVVNRFTEKPTLRTARRLLRCRALWNSGIFVWKASTLLELLGRFQPAIAAGLESIRRASAGKPLADADARLRAVIAREYKKMPNVSIDYAVLEPAGSESRVLTLAADFGWSDVGSWAAVHRMLRKDASGNAGRGRWIGVNAKNSLIHAPDRLVVLLGIENAFVVDTPDALLVGDLRRSQDVRQVVEQLQRNGWSAYTA